MMNFQTVGKAAQNPHNSLNDAQNGDSVDSVHGLGGIEILFSELQTVGVSLFIEDGRLAFDAPRDAMTPELWARVRAERDGLLAALLGEKPAGNEPSGVSCPFCRGELLEDVELGWRCCNCKRLAWVWLPGGSIVRADFENTNLAIG